MSQRTQRVKRAHFSARNVAQSADQSHTGARAAGSGMPSWLGL